MIKIKGITLPVIRLSLSLSDDTKESLVHELLEKLQSGVFSNSYFLIEADDTVDNATLKQIEKLLKEKCKNHRCKICRYYEHQCSKKTYYSK